MAGLLAALLSGLLFGAGLAVSGMMNPGKVIGFLDLAGAWDPSLAFVMGGALIVTAIGYRLAGARGRPLFEARFHLPTAKSIDLRLIGGAVLFGLGWGISGLCPGPAIAAATTGITDILIFGAAMLAGIGLFELASARRR
jgi:uncharacterized membrane protein YedE/YeeE